MRKFNNMFLFHVQNVCSEHPVLYPKDQLFKMSGKYDDTFGKIALT